jgi:hypothetical protein
MIKLNKRIEILHKERWKKKPKKEAKCKLITFCIRDEMWYKRDNTCRRERELFLKEVENGQEEEENNLINSEPSI